MTFKLERVDDKFDLVVTTVAGNVHRLTLYQSLIREHAESVAADARLPQLLRLLEGEPICAAGRCTNASPATVAIVATAIQLLQESVMQRQLGVVPVFADDEYTRMRAHESIFADAVEVLGSESAARGWLAKSAIGLDGRRPVDVLATAEGVQVVKDFLCRLRFGVYT